MGETKQEVVEAPPTEVSELHRTCWELYSTQLGKMQLELELLQGKANELADRARKAEAKLNDFKGKMRLIYGLSDADVVDRETGAITRAPVPTPKMEGA